MTRRRLDNRRGTDTFDVVHVTPQGDEQALTLSVGRNVDGAVAEVFVEVPYQQRKFATALLGKDVATLISIALQHGASVSELHEAMGCSDMNRMGTIVEAPHTIIGTVLRSLEALAQEEKAVSEEREAPKFQPPTAADEAKVEEIIGMSLEQFNAMSLDEQVAVFRDLFKAEGYTRVISEGQKN